MNAALRPHGRTRKALLLALAVGLGASGLTASSLPAALDDAWQAWVAARRPAPALAPVLVVGIDDASLESIGPWPWPRDRIASALARLQAAGVRAIGLHLPLEQVDAAAPVADARLARLLPGSRTVLGMEMHDTPGGGIQPRLPAPEFAEATRLGHVALEADRDGRSRLHRPQLAGNDGLYWASLAAELHRLGNAPPLPGEGPWRITALAGTARPGYRSFADLANGRLAETGLRDRWVLVGLAAPSLAQATPGPRGSGTLYPVQHQALALAGWLQGAAARPLPMPVQLLLAFVLAAGAVLAGTGGKGRGWRLPLAIATSAAVSLAIAAALMQRQWWFAPSGTLLALATLLVLWAAARIRRMLRTRPLPGLVHPARLRRATADAPAHVLLRIELAADASAPAPDLRPLATLLCQRARRPGDLVARTGPARFAILLPDTGAQTAARLAGELVEDARAAGWPLQVELDECHDGACSCGSRLDTRG